MTAEEPAADTPAACLSCVGRRTLLGGAAALGVGVALGTSTDRADASPSRWADVCLVGDIAVGDGLFFTKYGQPWVVTKPARGVFRGFSARCTHQGGICDDVIQRAIQCPVHGSRYALRTGRVVRGPATQALTRMRVRVTGRRVQMRF